MVAAARGGVLWFFGGPALRCSAASRRRGSSPLWFVARWRFGEGLLRWFGSQVRRCLALLGLLFLGAGLAVSLRRGGVACFLGLVVAMAAPCFPDLVGFATAVPPFPPFLCLLRGVHRFHCWVIPSSGPNGVWTRFCGCLHFRSVRFHSPAVIVGCGWSSWA